MRNSFFKHLLLIFCILVAIWWTWNILKPKYTPGPAMEIWVLDVGQGESILIREPSGKKMLFDGGPNDAVLSELGDILPVWDRQIDLVVLSHNHSDHIRGLITVLERFEVKEIWISGAIYTTNDYKAWQQAISNEGVQPKHVSAPHTEKLGELTLTVRHPLSSMSNAEPKEQHDATVSLEASYGNQDIFLTGDLETEHEENLVASCIPASCSLEAEILQVPHHGSASGLIPDFLAAVSPKVALIPVGLDNKFQHPRQNILDALTGAQIPIYRTDINGRLHLTVTASAISVQIEHAAPQ